MTIGPNHRMALAFGIAVPLLQTGRMILWGNLPRGLEWFIGIDAYLIGAVLLWGVVLAARKAPAGRLVLAAGWGFAGGIFYRTFFEQLGDSSRHGGHELLVLAFKGALLAVAVAGFFGAIRIPPLSAGDSPVP